MQQNYPYVHREIVLSKEVTTMLDKEFQSRLNATKKEEARLKKENERFIQLRLMVFLIGVLLTGFLLYRKETLFSIVVFVVMLVLFIALVIRHGSIRKGLKRCAGLIAFYEDFLKRISGDWTTFNETGSEYLESGHPYSSDLNVFGPKSLFQLLNLAHTFKGRQRLAGLLGRPEREKSKIEQRQNAVKELSRKLNFIEELVLRGLLHKKTAQDPKPFIDELKREKKVPGLLKNAILAVGLPMVTLFSAFFAGKTLPWLYFVLLSGLILQLLIFAWSFKTLSPVLGTVHQYKNELETYYELIELIENESFEDSLLKEIQSRFKGERRVSGEIKKLVSLSDMIDFKYSPLIYFVLNALFLWDLHLYRSYLSWEKRNSAKVEEWLDGLGELEALVSLSTMPMITPDCTYPEIKGEGPHFSAKALAHPFIPCDKRVANDVTINGTGIITGSNMSGKTTLLRTVGINLVLAYAGAPVCAASMSVSLMHLYTSMRNTDDLSEGVSTFYAELLRIKGIVDFSREEKALLFLIDEIFKGTNSKDRIDGARVVLKGLSKPWTLGLISTHDYELCELERDDKERFSNHHFTETYDNHGIHFDYKLHGGRCRTSNARYLMKMVGLDT